jgi:hypothetical protein
VILFCNKKECDFDSALELDHQPKEVLPPLFKLYEVQQADQVPHILVDG